MDTDPNTGERVAGQYLDHRVRREHKRLEEQQFALEDPGSVEDRVFQSMCNLAPESDPVVNGRPPQSSRISPPSTTNISPNPYSIASLRQFRSDYDRAAAHFRPPSILHFHPANGSLVPQVKYTIESRDFLQHRRRMEQLLEFVDGVESGGEQSILHMRRSLVDELQQHLQHLEEIVTQIWETKKQNEELRNLPGQIFTYENCTL